MRRRGFTLVELMTVLAILAILYAIAVPALVATKAAVNSAVSVNGLKELGQCTNMYIADSDDTAPLAMYTGPSGMLVAWFGAQTAPGQFDPKGGLLSAYEKGRPNVDPTAKFQPWIGDESGFGYNWGYIGSDFNLYPVYIDFPNCRNAANLSELSAPSTTILFATSSYFSAPWLPGGTGTYYDFGFVDPPHLWLGNPDVDFRHQGIKTVDVRGKKVTSTGHANVVRCDGSARPEHMGDVTDAMFMR
ncbi:MAG: type II secretion system protein [Fimbriimonadaceae bacterium]